MLILNEIIILIISSCRTVALQKNFVDRPVCQQQKIPESYIIRWHDGKLKHVGILSAFNCKITSPMWYCQNKNHIHVGSKKIDIDKYKNILYWYKNVTNQQNDLTVSDKKWQRQCCVWLGNVYDCFVPFYKPAILELSCSKM